ncbi:hypothetical protein HUG17_7351 [Dermatophagoides farinae]|uniref:A20-type domain-containing protein n=1 Tax=Dermatophagoides farinae TaxID=6954 RepID=A0A9D4NSW6_DERFA|nr:hypothetical protein HUG17_7351 [Dermatophagoides farinae]
MANNNIPKQCSNNDCRFYASEQFNGFCSACWNKQMKSMIQQQQQQQQQQHEQNNIRPLPEILRPTSRTTFRSSSYERSKNSIQKIAKSSHVSIKSIRMELDMIQNKINSNDNDEMIIIKNNLTTESLNMEKSDGKSLNNYKIIGFDCRCGGRYCIEHRLAKEHLCQFDYRTYGINELTKANPKVVGDKIKKI